MKTWETYLVEHYRPGASLDDLNSAVRDVRRAAAEVSGRRRSVRCIHCTIVPSDEALLAVFDATSQELVRDVYANAGIPFARITVAVRLPGEEIGSTAAQPQQSLTNPKGAE